MYEKYQRVLNWISRPMYIMEIIHRRTSNQDTHIAVLRKIKAKCKNHRKLRISISFSPYPPFHRDRQIVLSSIVTGSGQYDIDRFSILTHTLGDISRFDVLLRFHLFLFLLFGSMSSSDVVFELKKIKPIDKTLAVLSLLFGSMSSSDVVFELWKKKSNRKDVSSLSTQYLSFIKKVN